MVTIKLRENILVTGTGKGRGKRQKTRVREVNEFVVFGASEIYAF